jgi:myo-inositol-1(or 4)-monophosphatase
MQQLELAKKAAFKAGQIMLRNYPRIKVREKSPHNLVTQTDLEVEAAVVKMLRQHFPGHQVLSEEGFTETDLSGDHLWIMDPLDGTNNYAHQVPQFCISLAYAEKGEVLCGVVFDPTRKELFSVEKGKGAFLNGKPIQVSSSKKLSQCILGVGFYYDRDEMMLRTLSAMKTLLSGGIQGMRRMGSAALDMAWTACGRFDGYFEYKLHPWDFAAGMLLVREAGGLVYDREGKQMTLEGKGLITANPKLIPLLKKKVKWSGVKAV